MLETKQSHLQDYCKANKIMEDKFELSESDISVISDLKSDRLGLGQQKISQNKQNQQNFQNN